jgi:hypothetical protein
VIALSPAGCEPRPTAPGQRLHDLHRPALARRIGRLSNVLLVAVAGLFLVLCVNELARLGS